MLSFRDENTGEEVRTASAMGAMVALPKKSQKGHPYSFRLELAERDSLKDAKHVFSCGDADELKLWMDAVGAYSRMTERDVVAVETAAAEMTKLALAQVSLGRLDALAESDEDEDDATPRYPSSPRGIGKVQPEFGA